MPTIRRFEEIEAWKTARELTKLIYAMSNQGKFERDFGLRDQIRRASVSVMSNIAEGFESKTQPQFIKYLGYAKASAGEVRSQLYVTRDLEYISENDFKKAIAHAEKVSGQVARFIAYLERTPQSRQIREDVAVYDV
ncbi:MAG: four helix bundle protein [Anaerolineae bacterium]|nr:four helix bundle protein [Anaerolineae bacterium]